MIARSHLQHFRDDDRDDVYDDLYDDIYDDLYDDTRKLSPTLNGWQYFLLELSYKTILNPLKHHDDGDSSHI